MIYDGLLIPQKNITMPLLQKVYDEWWFIIDERGKEGDDYNCLCSK
jgi:hypothetical protein